MIKWAITSQNNSNRPRLIVWSFEHYKEKELVQGQARPLNGTNRLNKSIPKGHSPTIFPNLETADEWRGKKASFAMDKLYIDGQLYHDKDISSWHFWALHSHCCAKTCHDHKRIITPPLPTPSLSHSLVLSLKSIKW